jgi:hypothetical protein
MGVSKVRPDCSCYPRLMRWQLVAVFPRAWRWFQPRTVNCILARLTQRSLNLEHAPPTQPARLVVMLSFSVSKADVPRISVS